MVKLKSYNIYLAVQLALFAALTVVLTSGCTKETPFKSEYKAEVMPKSVIDTSSQFIYVASYASTSRSSDDAIPFFLGQEQLVKFRFAKNVMEIVSLDEDERFQGNQTNNKVIMTIPIEHKAYRCAQDKFGECTNKEEENKEISDLAKDHFKPDLAKLTEVSPSPLPADMRKYFNGCYEEKDKKVLNLEISPDAVNFQVEKTYQISRRCLDLINLEDWKDAVVTIVYHHSFAKLSAVSSTDYQPVLYPEEDENTFGFFTTEKNRRDEDNRDTDKNRITLMNRWSPSRSEVVYYLSDEFNKPENESLKKATYFGFEKINKALDQAGAKFRLVLKDPAGKAPGDIRNSMVVLVEDPSGAGLLGYGPSVANPLTGEIISARTVMYSGILKMGLRRAYEQIREEKIIARQKKEPSKEDKKEQKSLLHAHHSIDLGPARTPRNRHSAIAPATLASIKDSIVNSKLRVEEPTEVAKPGANTSEDAQALYHMGRLEAMSKHCTFPAELFNFEDSLVNGIESKFGDDMKPWESLSESEKKQAIDTLIPFVYVPVLIHEIGHNLGLRHNFKGSEDKNNWYAVDEIPDVKRPVPYSSVMDYGYRASNELPAMGKYDIAALRFAYSRQVEIQSKDANGQAKFSIVPVSSTLEKLKKDKPQLEFRDYQYCTDEHVGANPGCKRFDEGTTLTEITQHWMRSYEETYKMRNFRNGLRSFSMWNDLGYISSRYNAFVNLRLQYEAYERIKNSFGIPDDHPVWKSNPFLVDLREAAKLSGEFMIQILKTPDLTCQVSDARQTPAVQVMIPLRTISPNAISCFDKENLNLADGVSVIAQTGKFFQSAKDPRSKNPYVDQVDVRGIWADKLIAIELLFGRELGSPSFDRFTQSYLEMPELRGPLASAVGEILLDSVSSKVNMVDEKGNSNVVQATYPLFDTHVINRPLNPIINLALDLPMQETPFSNQMMRRISKLVPSVLHHDSSQEFMDLFSVYRMSLVDAPPAAVEERGGAIIEAGGARYIALPANGLALQAIVFHKAAGTVGRLNESGQKFILDLIKNGVKEAPAEIPEDLKALVNEALKLKPEVVEAVIAGQVKNQEFYTRLLSILPAKAVR